MERGNLFDSLPGKQADEWFEGLVDLGRVRVERIVSSGHRTPEGEWYDQDQDEWVMVIRGEARLRMADSDAIHHMGPGDWILLPAHCRHRVEWTDPDQITVWLAVHAPANPEDETWKQIGW